jgi:hypothetical protein
VPALADLVDRGIVRVLNRVMVRKHDEGFVEAHEIIDLDDREVGQFRSHDAQVAMLLSENDVTAIAKVVEPGSSAAVLVWENSWTAPFGAAVRHSRGQLVASSQIPTQALLAALEEDSHKTPRAADMPPAARRVRAAARSWLTGSADAPIGGKTAAMTGQTCGSEPTRRSRNRAIERGVRWRRRVSPREVSERARPA